MAIDFPNAPATNATYTVGNKTWIYDGTTWNTYNTTSFSAETLPGTTLKSTVTGSSLTSFGTLGSLTVAGDVTVDTNTLKVDSTNNRVGIGTVSPGYALEVQGAVAARSSATADGVLVYGSGTGSSSRTVSIYPSTLTGNQNFILPNATGVAAVFTTGDTAWTSYTPTLTQTATVTKTVTCAAYCKIGRLVIAQVQLAVTSAGTSGGAVLIGLPVTASASGRMCGSMSISSTGTSVYTHGPALANTTSVFGMLTTVGNYYGVNPTTALASGNVIQATLMYEAAS